MALPADAGELFPRVGFIVTNLRLRSKNVTRFYNQRGTAEQWIKEGKQVAHRRSLGVEPVGHVDDEVGESAFGQPLVDRRGQEVLLPSVERPKPHTHTRAPLRERHVRYIMHVSGQFSDRLPGPLTKPYLSRRIG
ncbi:hypothetical protein ACFL09_00900 [Planctomycetota bacterium]